MEWHKKEEMEMEMLLQEISCGHCHGYDDSGISDGWSSSSSGSISPSDSGTSATTLSSPDSSQRFSSSDGVALTDVLSGVWVSDEPEPDFERDPFEYSLFQAENDGALEKIEFKNEFGMGEYSAFPLEVNVTVPWVNNPQFDASIPITTISQFNPSCNANTFEQFSTENYDVPVSVSYYWKQTEAVECKSIDTRNYYLKSENLQGFKSKKLNERLIGVKGNVYLFANDQNGCRFLQKKLEEGKESIDLIFNGILSHIIELSVNPFGNYLMQKMIQRCNEEQRMHIVAFLTGDPSELVRVSLDIHGTRTVQKLVETIKTKEEISLVMSALQAGFLDIVKDLNGNHVIQRCLQSFDGDDNKLIFDAAIEHCVEISTHQHGCCVMQKCIAHSSDEHRERLIDAICANGQDLAKDSFGNYVVQYLLELKHSSALTKLAYQFEGRYPQLSAQKFSSNVVEKCLKVFTESEKAKIVFELLAVPQFELMLQHPYSNYVIQAALQYSKGSSNAALVSAIKPHATALRTNTYCKRIFRRALLRN
ncbi:putative pumilio 8 [Carex littledalei]|uniref:Putative pumilio 8 n=1 Tax=Carex littledalei TaxID=544730 RepID=A0A833RAU0_9POAL|nr:putative pumilio 8 [Carex littledalei]